MKFRMVWMGSDDDSDEAGLGLAADAVFQRPIGVWYEQRGTEMIRRERSAGGRAKVTSLTNFTARIVRDLLLDDDVDLRREFGLEANVGDSKVSFVLSAREFGQMGWVLNRLGPQAIIRPGQQQQVRAAIQWLSRRVPQERIFTRLGWTKHGENWIYLIEGGAIGTDGFRRDLQVQLPAALAHYHVEPPIELIERIRAVRASLRFLALAPDRISFPLLAATYRAALGEADFSIFVTGQTGAFKTSIAAVCQQHFGAEMDASHLPGNFASTANALEQLAFAAKDSIMVVDDFVPTGGPADGALQSLAERLFRSAGNRHGRSRMGGRQLRPPRPPRGLLLATGEEVPGGQSLRARLLVVELRAGEVDRMVLEECQNAAYSGLLAAAMGTFLCWLAGCYDQVRGEHLDRVRELHREYAGAAHSRLPGAVANLQSGFEMWLQFANELGAVNDLERFDLKERGKRAFRELLDLQAPYHHASDLALRFISLLRAALATGRAHVANRVGRMPESPATWGWRPKPSGRGSIPQGTRIGWVAGSNLFLDPEVSYLVAKQMAGADRLPISEQALRHRLHQHGLLASRDAGRKMLQVRRTLEGRPRQVLHLRISDLLHIC